MTLLPADGGGLLGRIAAASPVVRLEEHRSGEAPRRGGCQQTRGLAQCSEPAGSKALSSASGGARCTLALPASASPFNFKG